MHGIYLINKQHTEQNLSSQWPVLHWLLALDLTDQMNPLPTEIDYDKIWAETYGDIQDIGPTHRHMDRIFRRLLKGITYETLLDVGCGMGRNLALLREGRALKDIAGIDISRAAVDHMNKIAGGGFHQLDIQQDRLDGKWDLVFSSLILEHVRDDVAALKNLRTMTGKHLLLSTIAGDFEKYRKWEDQVGHVRNYKPGELETKLEQAGFEIRKIVRWGFPFFSPLARLMQNHTNPKADMGAAGRAAALLMYHLYFLNSFRKGDLLVILASV